MTMIETTTTTPRRRRSAVTTGRRRFVDLGNGGTVWGRRHADLVAGHVADRGGADLLSDAEVSIIKRAASLECELELMEGKLSLSEPIDLDLFQRTSNSLRRLLETIGLKRTARLVENPIVAEFNRKEAIRLAQYANAEPPDYSTTDFEAMATKGGTQP